VEKSDFFRRKSGKMGKISRRAPKKCGKIITSSLQGSARSPGMNFSPNHPGQSPGFFYFSSSEIKRNKKKHLTFLFLFIIIEI
jgi:hypothetical protein